MGRIKIEKFDYYENGNYEYSVTIVIEYNDEKKSICDNVNRFSSIYETESKLLRVVLIYEAVKEALNEIYNKCSIIYDVEYYEESKKYFDEKIIEKAKNLLKQFIKKKLSPCILTIYFYF